jgi:hypothetical protein
MLYLCRTKVGNWPKRGQFPFILPPETGEKSQDLVKISRRLVKKSLGFVEIILRFVKRVYFIF